MKAYKKTISLLAATACAGLAAPQFGLANDAKQSNKKSELHRAAKASTVEGMELRGKNGSELGTIDDIVVSAETGKIESLVVSTGFLGIGGPDRKISIDKVDNRDLEDRDIVTSLDGAGLDGAPIFDEDEFEQQRQSDQEGVAKQLMLVDTFNNEVEDRDGADQGEIHDWIVDVKKGVAPFAIVRVLRPFGTDGYDYFAVSSERLVGVNRTGEVVFDVDESDFTNAEHIDSDEPLRRIDNADIYQFRYNPAAVLSQN